MLSKKYSQFPFGVVYDPELRKELGEGERNLTIYKYPFDPVNKQDEPVGGAKSFQAW